MEIEPNIGGRASAVGLRMGAWLEDGSLLWKESGVIVEYVGHSLAWGGGRCKCKVSRAQIGLGGSDVNGEYVGHRLAWGGSDVNREYIGHKLPWGGERCKCRVFRA